jgi:hypothetical protein
LRSTGGPARFVYAVMVLSCNIVLALAVLSTVSQRAYGYVDPGSGLLAFQIIGTAFAGMTFLIRKRLRLLGIKLFGSKRKGSTGE